MTVRVDIAASTLRWALQRTGVTVEELAQKSDFRLVRQWLEGEVSPTLRQAQHLASLACIPFGYLLLDDPTDDQPDFPDFRTVDSKKVTEFSPELKETIYACERRLGWYAEFARAEGIEPHVSVANGHYVITRTMPCVHYFLSSPMLDGSQAGRLLVERMCWN
ncbi:hypothetical protein HMPREF2656_03990 [Corynebacterium sp. HMSC034B08]|uniref:helix-turn-helix domain-containing protein n=1 Tax=Corynebacterium sp. HMSC034B08 TaxID=1715135 RepID=UPI0008A8B6D3|nr:hypothetical protein [Corynebacterium sp. HMSC034B08]OHO27213.1 hypothetical protein HMPREF2656_03990 [Corynebacterium sp. HMSC034B08]